MMRSATIRLRKWQTGDLMIPSLILAVAVIVTTEFIAVGLLVRIANDFTVSIDQAAQTISVFALFAACLGALLTLIAGRFPLRWTLPGLLLLFASANIIPAAFPGFAVLLGARALQGGLLPPVISLASSAAAHFKGQDKAAYAIAQVNLGTIIGAVIALPLGVAVADVLGTRILFSLLGAAAIIAAGAVFLFTPEKLQPPQPSWGTQLRILQNRIFLCHLMLSTLMFAAMFATYSYIAPYLETEVGLTTREIALTLFAFGATGIIGNSIVAAKAGTNPTRTTVLVAGGQMLVAVLLIFANGKNAFTFAVLALWGVTHAAAFVSCQIRVMFSAPQARSFASALNLSVCNLGISLGAIFGGVVISHLGIDHLGLAAITLLVPTLTLGLYLMKKERG